MKMFAAAAIIAGLLLPLDTARAETSCLFVGNSQTYTFNLPGMFAELALAGNHAVAVEASTVSGVSLGYHTRHAATLALIQSRSWDHVILQEHTLATVIGHYVDHEFHPAVAWLDSVTIASGSHTTLFLHWARPFASGVYCVEDHCSREFADYFDMQTDVSSAYRAVAAERGLPVVPVGDAFVAALRYDPASPVWHWDEIHASAEGIYLAACVFYAVIFDESPVGLEFSGGLDRDLARRFQGIAGRMTGHGGPAPAMPVRQLAVRPNPFNPTTQIHFEVLAPTTIDLAIFDPAGRRRRGLKPGVLWEPGLQRVTWDGRDDAGRPVPSGTYLLQLTAGAGRLSHKLLLLQ